MKHAISLAKAKEMTARYRKEKENILAPASQGKDILSDSETFDAESIRAVLNQPGCKEFRIYFGMSENLKVHSIMVGVNDSGAEILEGENSIMEEGVTCPPYCPPPPPPPSLQYE